MILNINHTGQLLTLLLVINLCQNIKSNSAAIGYMCVWCVCMCVCLCGPWWSMSVGLAASVGHTELGAGERETGRTACWAAGDAVPVGPYASPCAGRCQSRPGLSCSWGWEH